MGHTNYAETNPQELNAEAQIIEEGTTTPGLTYGERAVGLKFNPSKDSAVDRIKAKAAALIDELHDQSLATEDGEVKAMLKLAERDVQSGQMWGVKAVTWNF